MQQNELLQSVLVQDYACNHNYKAGANFEPPPDQHTLYITSPTLCSQLQKLVFGMNLPYVLNFKLNTPMRGPFLWYFHFRTQLDSALDIVDTDAKADLDEFFDFLNGFTAAELASFYQNVEKRRLPWKQLSYLFVRLA